MITQNFDDPLTIILYDPFDEDIQIFISKRFNSLHEMHVCLEWLKLIVGNYLFNGGKYLPVRSKNRNFTKYDVIDDNNKAIGTIYANGSEHHHLARKLYWALKNYKL